MSLIACRRVGALARTQSLLKAPPVPAGVDFSLYQFTICPFCWKVKAASAFLGIPYKPVEVNPLGKPQLKWSKDYRKVPIAVFKDVGQVNGSNEIITKLLDIAKPNPSFNDPALKHWQDWADTSLAPIIYPNLTRSFQDSRTTLAYTSKAFPPLTACFIRNFGALGMTAAHGKVMKKYGITNERAALIERVGKLADELARAGSGPAGQPYLGGTEPALSDVILYGVFATTKDLPTWNDITKGWDASLFPPGHLSAFRGWLSRMDGQYEKAVAATRTKAGAKDNSADGGAIAGRVGGKGTDAV